MKARTSRHRFDESRRFNFVGEEMGRARLDSDANEQALITRTDARRRSGYVAEGSPDDGFLVSGLHLLDPVLGLRGWSIVGLPPGDLRDIREELTLARRDPESLPHVVRVRGATELRRRFREPVDLLRRPVPLDPAGATFQAAALVLAIRFERPPTDDEIVDVRIAFVDENDVAREVSPVDPAVGAGDWRQIRIPLAAFAAFPRSPQADGAPGLIVRGWRLTGLPPRAEVYVDALLVEDADVPESDFVLRGGDGSVAGAGRMFVDGWRIFIERDWRYSRQPALPNPPPLTRPADLSTRHLVFIDVFDRPLHAFEDDFLVEPALAGEPTTFRSVKTTQVRAVALPAGAPPVPPAAMGDGRLTTNMPEGARPDRFPPEDPDPCRDRCLFSENVSSGVGYRGKINAHVRIEILHGGEGLAAPIMAWARDNGAVASPLVEDISADSVSVVVAPEEAARYGIDDLVVLEDDWTRLDPGRDGHRPVLRRLRAVDTATGRLDFFPNPEPLTRDPAPLNVGGPAGRAFLRARHAAVRRWDGADWLLTTVRYNLRDGIDFGFDGDDFRAGEYWSFTARIANPDGRAIGVVEPLVAEPVHGPERVRAPLGLVVWTPADRSFVDLRARFMPLHSVRDRLIELGRRRNSPGAFTIVVGDGVRSFGDIDQNIAEGVTGDEAIQIALARLGEAGGTVYVRAGQYIFEHPVILQARNDVRILGDGSATRLSVTGAGGAFHLDACGIRGAMGLELMAIEETPAVATPFGTAPPAEVILGPLPDAGGAGADPIGGLIAGVRDARPLRTGDLALAPAGPNDLVTRLGERLRTLRPGFGRVGASIVRTIMRLRRLQRENPGQPLEDTAPEELAVLQSLPHGVVTLCDCRNVTIKGLDIQSRAATGGAGSVAAGVLITGDCADIRIDDNRIAAPAGIVALPYARYLSTAALTLFPRAALNITALGIGDNRIQPLDTGREGVRIADGRIDGLSITGNRVTRFPMGIVIEDRAETRSAGLDRIVVRDNQLVDITEVGLSVDGDGIDVEANEIRLSAAADDGGAASLHAGVRATGTGVRIRDCWISLPSSPAGRGPLALEAGVLIGGGVVAGRLVARAVSDLEVIDTRIEGAGAATLADGIVIAGPQPAFDLRFSRNVIRSLGGAGIRAMGHAGAIGSVHITDNRIVDVARSAISWGAAAVQALGQLEPRLADLGANTSPRDALERLLGLDRPSEAALDAMLRWLDVRMLRGAVVLSQVDGAEVARNTIQGIGTRNLPAGFFDLGSELRTAGMLGLGGRDLVASSNVIEDVVGVAQPIVFNPPPLVGPVRPPVLDLLDRIRLEPLAPAGPAVFVLPGNLHDLVAGLRGNVAAFAIADEEELASARSGLRLAVGTVLPQLRAAGGELAVVAERIGEAADMITNAVGDAAARDAADLLRGAVSDAAGITAPDSDSAAVWSMAGAFDRTALASREVVLEQAEILARRIEELPREQAAAAPELSSLVRAVIDAPDNARARRMLAAETGRLALIVETAQTFDAGPAAPEPPTRPEDREDTGGRAGDEELRAVREMAARIGEMLSARPPRGDRLENAISAIRELIDRLAEMAPERAERIQRMVTALVEARPPVSEARLSRLRQLIQQEVAGAIEDNQGREDDGDNPEDSDQPTGDEDGDGFAREVRRRESAHRASLLAVAAKAVDLRLAEATALDQLDESFELRLAEEMTRQLSQLTEGDADLQRRADDAVAAIATAATSPDRSERETLRQAARVNLDAITRAGAIPGAATAGAAIGADRLGALGQLSAEIGQFDDAALRSQAVELFASAADRIGKSLAMSDDLAEETRRAIDEARRTLSQDAPAAAARDAAIEALAAAAERITEAARRAPAAAPETETLAFLTQLNREALAAGRNDQERLARVHDRVAAAPGVLSPALRSDIVRAASIPDLLSTLRLGLGTITRIPPVIVPNPPTLNGFRAHPADGIYCAAVAEHLILDSNRIGAVRIGIVVAGPPDHPLAPTGQAAEAVKVTRNEVVRAPVAAFDLRPAGNVALLVADNSARACAGAADPDAGPNGQGVITITGQGELDVNRNRMANNGNAAAVGLLHEVVIDWRGDVTLRGNRIRHAGGARGGAGILLLTGTLTSDLVARLSREPALVVEPLPEPPSRPRPPGTSFEWLPGLLDPQIFAVSMASMSTQAKRPAFDFGGLTLADAGEPMLPAAFDTGPRTEPSIEPAVTAAASWLADRPLAPIQPLVGFLAPRPVLTLPPRPRTRRSVQVVGNDVTAAGPALQILHDGSALISAGITGNDLESSARTGAVYLRNLDAVVFSGNRCESLREVNVVVLRCGSATVTASANGLVGGQPAAPPPKPLPKPPGLVAPIGPVGPIAPAAPGLSLKLDLGGGAGLSLPLRADALLAGIKKAGSGNVFADVAEKAEASFKVFAAEKAISPALRILNASELTEARSRATMRDAGEGEADAPQEEVQVALNTILTDATLPDTGKLFAVAKFLQFSDSQARNLVARQLEDSSGDAAVALQRGINVLAGSGESGPAAIAAAAAPRAIMEDLIGFAVAGKKPSTIFDPGRFTPLPLPPPPRVEARDRSLVIIGGARVAAVGNATTAGVYVHPGPDRVLLNV